MNSKQVSYLVGRKPGMVLTIAVLLLAMVRPARAKEVVITITGVLDGGYDQFHMFNVGTKLRGNGGWDIKGQPFTLVFIFDDSKGKPISGRCPNSGTGVEGGGPSSPGKAVLTVAGVSYTFDNKRGSSGVWREITGQCGTSSFMAHVNEATAFFDFAPSVDVKILPGNGSRTLSQNPDWRTPISVTNVDNQTSCFFISRPGDHSHEAKGCFDIRKLEIK